MRAVVFTALAVGTMSACSVLIPLDEFLTDGPGGGGAGAGTGSGGNGGASTSTGGADPGCTPERETDPNNCGEAGYECEEGICESCMCAPHSMGDFVVTALLFDFGFGRKADSTEVVVASLSLPLGALDVLGVARDSWAISDEYFVTDRVSERLIPDAGRYFYASDAIYARSFDLAPSDPSTLICQYSGRTVVDTFDHLARGGSHIYRSVFGQGAATGRIDQCLTDLPMPTSTYADVTTSAAWEVVASSNALLWTNRTLGGGVHRKPSSNFASAPPETLYSQPDGVPTALALIDGQVFFADCARGEILVVPPGQTTAMSVVTTLGHVAFFEAYEEDDGSVTFYAIETADVSLCASPLPAIYDGALVRYRAGIPRVLATGIRLPTSVRVHDGYVYFSRHREGTPAPPPEVMRLPL